jgi:hypothetical protein
MICITLKVDKGRGPISNGINKSKTKSLYKEGKRRKTYLFDSEVWG